MSDAIPTLRIDIFTLFPGMFDGVFGESIIKRARAKGLIDVQVHDIRDWTYDRHRTADDTPYGGGAGMVMRVDVAAAAIDEAYADDPPPDEVVLLSPAGERLTQRVVEELATRRHVCLLSARYEGFDARVEGLVTREVSIGDFVLMGGELPALCVVEAVTRLLPGALGDEESHRQDSFASGLLDYPEYTRPAEFRGLGVPEVLLSGHHAKVAAWRRREALRRTLQRRPDLLETADLTPEDERELASLRAELAARAAPAVNGDGQDDEAGR